MKQHQNNESHLAVIDFLWIKLCEHKTWTREKRAVFSSLRKYLVHIGAKIVYKKGMNNLKCLGSHSFLSNNNGWADRELERGTAELRVLIGHSDPSQMNKGKEFAILKFSAYSLEKHHKHFKRLQKYESTNVHDLWFKDDLPEEMWDALVEKDKRNEAIEFMREDEGVGATWYGVGVTKKQDLDFALYSKLEKTAIELQELGGMYPRLSLRFLTKELIVVELKI